MLRGGVLAITSCDDDDGAAVNFVAARPDSDPQALAACRASSLAARRFQCLVGLARTDDGLLACNVDDPSAALYKFALDGSMDELATVPALAEYRGGFSHCAVHQQTQRTYAIARGRSPSRSALVLLDSSLRVDATVDAVDCLDAFCDVAVHGDQVIVLTGDRHPKGSGLQLLDLDGRFLRTIAFGRFRHPQAVAASHRRVFVADDCFLGLGGLHVIDIQSGDLLQTVRFESEGGASAIIADGDEIYIADNNAYIADNSAGQVVVLQLAGSEA